jgi:hypothetical protein
MCESNAIKDIRCNSREFLEFTICAASGCTIRTDYYRPKRECGNCADNICTICPAMVEQIVQMHLDKYYKINFDQLGQKNLPY